MGLDTVELVMAIEGESSIAIPNDRAATLITPGDVRDLVAEILEARGEVVARESVWVRIQAIMRRDHGIADEHLAPDATIVADLGLDRRVRPKFGMPGGVWSARENRQLTAGPKSDVVWDELATHRPGTLDFGATAMTAATARTGSEHREACIEDDAQAVERRAAAFARELGAVGEVGWLLSKRAAVLAGRMEQLAGRDGVMVSVSVEAAQDAFDDERRAERAAWLADLDGDDSTQVAAALTHLELSPPGLDALHRLWGRVLEGLRSDDPARIAGASAQARRYLDATGTGIEVPGDAAGLAACVAAEATRLRARDERTRAALAKMMADARREAGLAAAFDPSPEATLARRHEAAAERGFFRAIKLIRELRRDAGLADVATAEARAPLPPPAPEPRPALRPAERPARRVVEATALGSFLPVAVLPPSSPADPLGSFRVGAEPGRPRLARIGGKRR